MAAVFSIRCIPRYYHRWSVDDHIGHTGHNRFPLRGSLMRSRFLNILSLALVVIAMFSATAIPQAAAQTPETGEPPPGGRPFTGGPGIGGDDFYPAPPTGCEDVPPAIIQVDGDELIILFPEIWSKCVINVVVEVCSDCVILFDGRPPASRILRLSVAGLETGDHTITVTGTTIVEGIVVISSLIISTGVGPNPSVPAIQAIDLAGLATTGNNVDFPVAAGVALLGAGGLVLLVARQREQKMALIS
jgi:hypothetical protein